MSDFILDMSETNDKNSNISFLLSFDEKNLNIFEKYANIYLTNTDNLHILYSSDFSEVSRCKDILGILYLNFLNQDAISSNKRLLNIYYKDFESYINGFKFYFENSNYNSDDSFDYFLIENSWNMQFQYDINETFINSHYKRQVINKMLWILNKDPLLSYLYKLLKFFKENDQECVLVTRILNVELIDLTTQSFDLLSVENFNILVDLENSTLDNIEFSFDDFVFSKTTDWNDKQEKIKINLEEKSLDVSNINDEGKILIIRKNIDTNTITSFLQDNPKTLPIINEESWLTLDEEYYYISTLENNIRNLHIIFSKDKFLNGILKDISNDAYIYDYITKIQKLYSKFNSHMFNSLLSIKSIFSFNNNKNEL